MNGCIVLNQHEFFKDYQFQEYGEVDIRNTLIAASRVNLDTLVIDINVASATTILQALHTYRVQRPDTRTIVLAPNRQPGDMTVAGIIALGIYDIVATEATENEKAIQELRGFLDSPPATYAQAARWAVQIKEEPEPEKRLWERFSGRKKDHPSAHDDKDDKKEDDKTAPQPDPDILAGIIKEIERINQTIEKAPNSSSAQGAVNNIAGSAATIGNTVGAIFSIMYNLIKTGIYLLLGSGLIVFVLFLGGKVAGVLLVDNSLTQFLVGAATAIETYFKGVF